MARYSRGYTAPPKPAHIFWSPSHNMYCIKTHGTFGEAYRNDLNMFCSSSRWDGTNKVWLVDESDLAEAINIVTVAFNAPPTVDYKPQPKADVDMLNLNDTGQAVIAMFAAAGPEVSKRVYNLLLKEYHPDMGTNPDVNKTATITVGYRALKRALGWG